MMTNTYTTNLENETPLNPLIMVHHESDNDNDNEIS